jgi:hypothetical protein
VVTAIARIFPVLTCGSKPGNAFTKKSTSPLITPTSAGAAPLYGTCTVLIPAIVFSISPMRCEVPPTEP